MVCVVMSTWILFVCNHTNKYRLMLGRWAAVVRAAVRRNFAENKMQRMAVFSNCKIKKKRNNFQKRQCQSENLKGERQADLEQDTDRPISSSRENGDGGACRSTWTRI